MGGLPGNRQALILSACAAFAVASLIGSPYPALAPLQNIPTLIVIAAVWIGLRNYPFSDFSVSCLALFLALHTLGGRYIYSNVPYEEWIATLGLRSLQDTFALQRNHYDRLVHFSFGLLLFFPLREGLRRYSTVSRAWATYIAVEFVLAGSALYEIFEWGLTLVMAGEGADAYNGQQGDAWDAQKDMALAFLGALTAAAVASVARRR